jgi:hypothetical protein
LRRRIASVADYGAYKDNVAAKITEGVTGQQSFICVVTASLHTPIRLLPVWRG